MGDRRRKVILRSGTAWHGDTFLRAHDLGARTSIFPSFHFSRPSCQPSLPSPPCRWEMARQIPPSIGVKRSVGLGRCSLDAGRWTLDAGQSTGSASRPNPKMPTMIAVQRYGWRWIVSIPRLRDVGLYSSSPGDHVRAPLIMLNLRTMPMVPSTLHLRPVGFLLPPSVSLSFWIDKHASTQARNLAGRARLLDVACRGTPS